MDDFINFN